MFTLQRRT